MRRLGREKNLGRESRVESSSIHRDSIRSALWSGGNQATEKGSMPCVPTETGTTGCYWHYWLLLRLVLLAAIGTTGCY